MENSSGAFDARGLLDAAAAARANAYAPYSHFAVGAAVLAADGRVFTGCNVENAAYPACLCAERVALGKAVSEGARPGRLVAVAVAGGRAGGGPQAGVLPCGECRQVMAELGGAGLRVVTRGAEGAEVFPLGDLLPFAFGGADLAEGRG